MADNVQLPPTGTGTADIIVATDKIAGVDYQKVKLVDGTADSTSALPGDATAGLKVNLGADNDVTVTGTVTAISGTAANLKAEVVGTGTFSTQVTSVPAPLSTTGGGTEATAHRVTIATDSTGVLSVDDNGGNLSIDDGGNVISVDDGAGSLTVDGTVTAISGTAANLKAEVVGTGTFVTQSVVTNAGTFAVQAAATNAGTFVVQENGAALTALQLIDDGVYTDDTSTHSTGTSKGYGIMAAAAPTDANVDANDIGMVAMTTARQLKVDASGVAVPITDNAGSITIDGSVGLTTPVTATTATLTNTNDSGSNVTVQASNAARKGLILYNDSTQPAYVKFGATATTTSFTVYMLPGATYEMGPNIYSGIVDAIWAADASGAMRATEW